MFEPTIDHEIFKDFCKTQPSPIPFGSVNENIVWLSFWQFLLSGTNLIYILNDNFNFEDSANPFFTQLSSSGQGDREFKTLNKFNWPHGNKLPQKTFPGSFFCIIQEDQKKREQLVRLNGMLFGFINDYKDQWEKLSISGRKHHTFHVRKGFEGENSFKNWATLSQYILPFTDVIICDKYINDKFCRDHNLLEIIRLLDKQAIHSYNLLIITNKGDRNFLDEFEKYIKEKIKKYTLKAKFGIVLSSKEHDRCIIMNYLKIESGDSFNFFNRDGTIITNGTELKLFPLCYSENYDDVRLKLSILKKIVANENEDIRGNLNNRLFEYCED